MPRYWLCYDLGLRGKYDELYAWLDSLGAKECAGSVATFVSKKSREQLARELKKLLGDSGARIYVISMKQGGKFIAGKRRAAPWAGYAVTEVDSGVEA